MTQQGIRLTPVGADGEGSTRAPWLLSQNRPRIAESLTHVDLQEALTRIPLLLPICSVAQLGAAKAAVDALVHGKDTIATRTDPGLLREQGLAHAWRWLVTWSPLLGNKPDLLRLRDIRAARDDKQLAKMLEDCVPGLDRVSNVDDLKQWAAAQECPVALFLAQLFATEHQKSRGQLSGDDDLPTARLRLLDQTMIYDALRAAYLGGDLAAKALLDSVAAVPLELPVGRIESIAEFHSAPCYVGPLAVWDHLFDASVESHVPMSLPLKIFVAQLFDAMDVIRKLASGTLAEVSAWSMTLTDGAALGVGSSMTSRGPLFHLLSQTPRDKERGVASTWQIFAPTDWHFKDSGLLQHLLLGQADPSVLSTAIVALDPCCAAHVGSSSLGEDSSNA